MIRGLELLILSPDLVGGERGQRWSSLTSDLITHVSVIKPPLKKKKKKKTKERVWRASGWRFAEGVKTLAFPTPCLSISYTWLILSYSVRYSLSSESHSGKVIKPRREFLNLQSRAGQSEALVTTRSCNWNLKQKTVGGTELLTCGI